MNWLIYGMVYLGSALMVYNIYSYIQYARHLQELGDWGKERNKLYIPIFLLIAFLLGYLAVGIFGKPDLIVSGILFGGSIFVFIIFRWLQFVTDRVQEKEHLEAELYASRESTKIKAALLASMSHEMRTPMNAIIGMNSIALKNPNLQPETRLQLEKIGDSAEQLMSMISNMLDMNDIDSGKIVLKEDTFSLYEMLDQINKMIRTQCDTKKLDFNSSVIGELHDYYTGDQVKLRQILLSILDNAVKYTPSPGTITFTTEQIESEGSVCKIRFVIHDTGIGMSKEFLSQIFGNFSRENIDSTSLYGGIGMALAITKKFIEAMDGSISVVSEKGIGSTFTVNVSLGKTDKNTVEPGEDLIQDPQQSENYPIRGARVLVVEDIDLNAEIVMDLLDMEEVSSDRAEDGEIAVKKISESQEHYYDAILMDLRMPHMDGLEAARTIRNLERSDTGNIPIIALTANIAEEDKQKVKEAGMDAHLSKPVDPDLLYETLGRLISRNRKSDYRNEPKED